MSWQKDVFFPLLIIILLLNYVIWAQKNELAFLYQEGLYQPWEYAKNNSVGGLHPFFPNLIIPQYVEFAHERDIKVRPWTVDEPEQMAMLIGLGVDGLITNDPVTAVKVRANLKNN